MKGCGGGILEESEDEDVLSVGNHLETINLSRFLHDGMLWIVKLPFDGVFNGNWQNFNVMNCTEKSTKGKRYISQFGAASDKLDLTSKFK